MTARATTTANATPAKVAAWRADWRGAWRNGRRAAVLALSLLLAGAPLSLVAAQTPAPASQPANQPASPPAAPAGNTKPAAAPAGDKPAPPAAPSEQATEAARLAAASRAQTLEKARTVFDREKVRLAEIETILARRNHTGQELNDLRGQLGEATSALQAALAPLTQRATAAKALLDQLGPRPDEKKDGPETAEAAAEREARQRNHTEYADTVRIGNALLLQANQLTEQVTAERRDRFTHALFDRTWSILSPEMWGFVVAALPANLKALAALGADWLTAVETRINDRRMLPFGLSLGALVLVWLGRRLVLHRIHARGLRHEKPGPLRRAVVGLLVTASDTAAVTLACWFVYLGLQGSNLVPPALEKPVNAALFVVVLLAFVRALIKTLLSPVARHWRVLDVPDQTAAPAAAWLMTGATVLLAGKVLGDVLEAAGGDRASSVALDALTALAVALCLATMLRAMRDNVECAEQSLGPYVPPDGAASGIWRLAGWAIVALVTLAVLAGFVPLASFLTDQTLWTLMLLGSARLLLAVIDQGVAALFDDNSRVSVAMQTSIGVRKRSLNQLAVVLAGVLRIVVIALAVLLALAPLGIDSTDFVGSIRNVFFGLHVAGFNISLLSIFSGLALLVLGIVLTRAFQSWLRHKFLPATSLDSGLRNSITTAAGYLGVFIAVAATLANFGLSLDRIAIVAGALSVGIGFGLQSVVNNFVSGLILLWDRSISVGDWIVVGSEQGYVKRISVRATEIQTFERASIIVPNSTIVSGTVKNWLRHNRTGRISIVVPVGFQQSPQTISDLLLACAKAHPDVLREPKPSVLFNSFTGSTQEFELRCFGDVESMSRIKSELNYSIFEALTEAGVYAAPKPALSEVRLLMPDDMQELLSQRLRGASRPEAEPGDAADRDRATDRTGD